MNDFIELEIDPAYCENWRDIRRQTLMIRKSAIIGMVDHGPYTKLILRNGKEIEVIEPIKQMLEALE